MKQRVIGIDIDGVLANFNEGYRKRLAEVTGRALIPEGFAPSVWYYATEQYGYTKDEDRATWKSVCADTGFWLDLAPYGETFDFLCDLWSNAGDYDEVYFITTRPGDESKYQTEQWLANNGFENATVLIARGNKGSIASGLGLTHFIDDKPENCRQVAMAVAGCEVFVLDALYNRPAQDDLRDIDVKVIGSLHEFTDAVFNVPARAAA